MQSNWILGGGGAGYHWGFGKPPVFKSCTMGGVKGILPRNRPPPLLNNVCGDKLFDP